MENFFYPKLVFLNGEEIMGAYFAMSGFVHDNSFYKK